MGSGASAPPKLSFEECHGHDVHCLNKYIRILSEVSPVVIFVDSKQGKRSDACEKVLTILADYDMEYFDITEDEQFTCSSIIRTLVTHFSGEILMPQVFINGNFFGGAEKVLGIEKSGILHETLASKGLKKTVAHVRKFSIDE